MELVRGRGAIEDYQLSLADPALELDSESTKLNLHLQ